MKAKLFLLSFLSICLFYFFFKQEDKTTKISLPSNLSNLDQILLASDVDGVIRSNIDEDSINPKIVKAIKRLVKNKVKIAFISGSPAFDNPNALIWEQDSHPIGPLFYKAFKEEIDANKITVIGTNGGEIYKHPFYDTSRFQYSSIEIFNISKHLLTLTLENYKKFACSSNISYIQDLLLDLRKIKYLPTQAPKAHYLLASIAERTQKNIDPEFRLINRLSEVEIRTKTKLTRLPDIISSINEHFGHIAYGHTGRQNIPLSFLKISKLTKKNASNAFFQLHSTSKNSLNLAIGDGPVDLPLYESAHLAFHVGNPLKQLQSNTTLILDSQGNSDSHIHGTINVLKTINKWCESKKTPSL